MTTSVGLTHEEHVTAKCDVSLVRDKRVLTCLSLHDGSPLADSSPSHCACVILRHCRLFMEKSDESQFFENMPIYLKHKKMVSQWTKQMRWRIKKSDQK